MKDHLVALNFAVLQRNRFHVFLSELAGSIQKDWRSQKYTFWGGYCTCTSNTSDRMLFSQLSSSDNYDRYAKLFSLSATTASHG